MRVHDMHSNARGASMETLNTERFEAWLVEQGYRPQTTEATLKAVRQIAAHDPSQPPSRRLKYEARRALAYLGESVEFDADIEACRENLVAVVEAPNPLNARQQRLKGGRGRKKVARSIADNDWTSLLTAIAKDETPQAIVLDVLAGTGLRIGDVLGITRAALERAQHTGRVVVETKGGKLRELPLDGADTSWRRLWNYWCSLPGMGASFRNVARLCAPQADGRVDASGGGYTSVARCLARLAREAGVDGRVHLHRIRRTVGVQALRATEDTMLVKELLDHESIATTMGYLDEARPDHVAKLQRQVRNTFGRIK